MQYMMFLHDSPVNYGTYCLVLFIGNRTFTASVVKFPVLAR
jgi:hypothetical protein